MKFLVIGYGSIGKRHAANIASMGHTAVLLRHAKGNENQKGMKEYYSYDEAFEKEGGFDGAVICSPTTKHLDDVKHLVAKRIPFLLEKPPTYELRSAREMLEVVESSNFTAYDVGFNLRYHPVIRFVKGFLPSLGPIYATRVYVGYYLPYWRKGVDYRETASAKKELGGGVHVELAHDIDYTLWFLGYPRKVTGYVNRVSDLEISTEDLCSAMMKYDNGSIAEIHLDYLSQKYLRGGQIIAKNGTLEWQWNPAEGKVLYYDKDSIHSKEVFEVGQDYDFNSTYIEELKNFIGIIMKQNRSMVGMSDAVKTMKVIGAIEVSNSKEQWVTMEEMD